MGSDGATLSEFECCPEELAALVEHALLDDLVGPPTPRAALLRNLLDHDLVLDLVVGGLGDDLLLH